MSRLEDLTRRAQVQGILPHAPFTAPIERRTADAVTAAGLARSETLE